MIGGMYNWIKPEYHHRDASHYISAEQGDCEHCSPSPFRQEECATHEIEKPQCNPEVGGKVDLEGYKAKELVRKARNDFCQAKKDH